MFNVRLLPVTILVAVLLVGLAVPQLAYGQEIDDSEVEDVFELSLDELLNVSVGVSSTTSETVFHAPSTVTVLDREMLEKYNFLTVAEALESVAGMDIYQTIIDKNVATARGILQNFYANKVLLLIDNVPTWQPIYGDGHLERIDINDVERIEVLKGPASVLYGSNAYSGVINIVLREVEITEGRAYGRAGVNGPGGAGAGIRYVKNHWKLLVSANGSHEEREPVEIPAAQGFSYQGETGFLYTGDYLTRNFNLRAEYKGHSFYVNRFRFNHSFMGAHPSYAGGGGNMVKNNGVLFNYRYSHGYGKKVMVKANLSYDYFKREFPLSQDRVNVISLSGARTVADMKIRYKGSKKLAFELGGAVENRNSFGHNVVNGIDGSVMRHNLKEDEDILEWSAFAQVDYQGKAFHLLAGSRYTNNAYFGGNFASRITGVIKLRKQSSLKLIFGQSFRVPTMFELYFDHPTVVGRRGLEPETSTSYEAAYLAGFKHFYFQVLGYYAIYDNLIQRVTPETGPPSNYRNVDQFKGYGAEVELRYRNSKVFNGFLNYNFMKGVGGEADANYDFVPRHTVYFGLDKRMGSFFVSVNGKWISKVKGHLEDIDPQFMADLSLGLSHKVRRVKLRHVLSVKNITGSDMLTPEYIRRTPNINALPVTGYGRRLVYTVYVSF